MSIRILALKHKNKIRIEKKKWTVAEFTTNNKVKIKNFYGGKELNWKVLQ